MRQGGLNVDAGGVTVDAGGLYVQGGHTVTAGGIQVLAGGATINGGGLSVLDDGAIITNSATDSAVLSLTASNAGYLNTVLKIDVPNRGSSSSYNLLVAQEGANVWMRLRVRCQLISPPCCTSCYAWGHILHVGCHRAMATCSPTGT